MGSSRPIRPVGSNQLRVKEGGGCLSLFGLPFLAAGILGVLAALGIVPVENASELPGWGWPILLAWGLVFTGVGGGLVFGRKWVTLDAGRGRVLKQWGLLIPFHTEEHRLKDFGAVLFRHEAGDSDSSDRYPVLLRGREGRADLPLTASTVYADAREQATELAAFLGLPMVDASTTHEVLTAPEAVNLPLGERLRSAPELPERAPRPTRPRSQIRERGGEVEILLPGPRFRKWELLGPAVPVGLLAWFGPQLLRFFRETGTPEFVQWGFLGFGAFLFVFLPFLGVAHSWLRALRGGTRVTVSREGLVLEVRGAWGRTIDSIPAADILGLDFGTSSADLASIRRDVDARFAHQGKRPPPARRGAEEPRWMATLRRLVPSQGITVKGRKKLITFGAGLPDDEVRWLHSEVLRALVGGEKGD